MDGDYNIDQLYKKNFGTLIAQLARKYSYQDIGLIEDIVQDTFVAAHQQWPTSHPENPVAWLYKVSANMASKEIGRRQTNSLSTPDNRTQVEAYSLEVDTEDIQEPIQFLLLCASLPFSPKQQIVFALRYAASFKVSQIAFILGTTAENITKMLQRIRDKVKVKMIPIRKDGGNINEDDKLTVLKILYLMFSEGYKTSRGEALINETLCEDALSMTQTIVQNPELSTDESKALLALMLFNLSRFESRFNSKGEIVDLEEQDRSKWNQSMIKVATRYLNEARSRIISTYHLEATVAYLHCSSLSFNKTDWHKIIQLYEQLSKINESPFVRLNLGIAQFYSGETSTALATLEELGSITYLNNYHIYHISLGKIFNQLRKMDKSIYHLQKGLRLTSNKFEKQYLEKLILKLN